MADISVKQGEAKTLTFTITQAGVALDVTGGGFKFAVKETKDDTTYKIEKDTVDFGVGDAALGKLYLPLSETDLGIDPGEYVAELKIDLTTSSSATGEGIDKSADLSMEVCQPVITD